jgi:Late exocytosis, associated with Golgi transport
MCFQVTAVSAVVSLAVLIPVYITGKDSTPASTGYNTITMANVKEGGGRLWASLAVYYLFIALMLSALWKEWKHFLPLRYKFLAEGDVDTEMEYR